MDNPLVSIIIPTFNRENLIGETLDSIAAQTFTDWECLIIDDGSTDKSLKLFGKYNSRDPRFSFYSRPSGMPKGGNTCRNYGFTLSKGKYIKWFDSDDLMYPDFLEVQVNILNGNSELDFCACQWDYFYEDNRIVHNFINLVPTKVLSDYFFNDHVFVTPSPLWNKDFLKDKPLFDPTLFRAQESDFHFRMLTFQPKYQMHPEFLFRVRRGHPSIESDAKSIQAQVSVMNYFEKAFRRSVEIDFADKSKVQDYLAYRVLNQSANIVSLEEHFVHRLRYISYLRKPWRYIKQLGPKNTVQFFLGMVLYIAFRKGYNIVKSAISQIK
ncbi:MAG TPA: glycosyltransferase family A protein [Flavobacterium sp.]|jgi:glycosyltransferase involved in cell wall biosynthesis